MNSEARVWLARLELISHGTTQAWNSSGKSHDATAKPGQTRDLPPGETHPPHIRFRFLLAQPGADVEFLIGQMRRTWDAIVRSDASSRPIQHEESAKRDKRIASLVDAGWTWAEIALKERSTVGEVKKAATRHHQANNADAEPSAAQWEQARRMQAQGCSLRQIEFATRISRSTLQRRLAA